MTRHVSLLRLLTTVFVVAVLLNFPWEMAQARFYAPMGSVIEATWRCFVASLGDGLIILVLLSFGAAAFGGVDWFRQLTRPRVVFLVATAFVIAILVEWWGLETGRWAYAASMPRMPVFDVGVLPLLQMPFLAPLTFYFAAAVIRKGE